MIPVAAALSPLVLLYGTLFIGRYEVAFADVQRALIGLAPAVAESPDAALAIVQQIRLPRALLALCVGAGLSIAGAAYQGLFRNPLVSPDALGATAAAAFGAALALLWGAGPATVQGAAFVFGVAGVAITASLARSVRSPSLLMLILSGVVVAAFFGALLGAVKYLADPDSRLPAITYWLLGSLNGATWRTLAFVAPPIVAGTVVLWLLRWQLNVLAMGEEEARALGVRTGLVRVLTIVATTAITAAAVSACGVVGWIGLVVPHLARMLVGPDHRRLLPVALCLGGSYLIVIDTLARSLTPGEIPVGILTAIAGAPFCAWLLRRTRGAWT
ncbi:iron ABC transporter permease [bacterium]|nr:MAG: iron ABC transporter permease [bacterium]